MSEQNLPDQQQPPATKSEPPSSDVALPSSPPRVKHDETAQPVPAPSSDDAPDNFEKPTNPRLVALAKKQTTLEAKLADLQSQRSALVAEAKLPSGLEMPADWSEEQKHTQAMATANGVVKEHIKLLHGYNEIKDIGQGLMGLVAEKRGVRVAAIMEEYGMGEKD